jgi:DNA-binding transcriptional ArsR family regulator
VNVLGAAGYGVLLISMLLTPLVTAFASVESTHFIVSVYVDGSARWVVEHRYPLRSEEDVEAFRVVAANVSKELSETYRLRLQTVIQEASRLTGRAMGLTEFAVHTSTQTTVTGSVGIIVVEFVLTGFAATADGKISVGDVFVGGLSLASGETLTLKIPEGYNAVDYSPKPDEARSDSLTWYGPRTFTDRRPLVVLSKLSGPAVTGASTGVASGQGRVASDWLFAVLLVAVAASGASAALLMRRRGSVGVQESGFREIIEVLRRHGGEAPQHVIVEETGLSKASVSMMLKALEASGVVVRVKSGKTKVVRLVK